MKKIKYVGIDEYIYYEKLNSGLEIFMYPNKTAKNFYLTFNTKFGSMNTKFKYEGEKGITKVPNGTAHFLEHQMFQEENGHTAFEKYASLGSSINAFTTYNLTCYEVISSNNFKENLEYLLDYVQNPIFVESSIKNEKGIIKEEIKMYDNNPNAVSTFGLEYNLNVKDNHKYPISGCEEDIKEINSEILYKTYDAFYQPSNMFIVLTGNFNPLEALGIIKENQKKKQFDLPKKVITIKEKEPSKVFKNYEEKNMSVATPKIRMAYKIPKKDFKGYNKLTLRIYLDAILSLKFGSTSDLLEKMTEENLISFDILPSREVRDDYVVINIYLESEYIEESIELIRDELKKIKITKEELSRIKKANVANFIMHFNDIISVCEDIQDDVINEGNITSNILDIYKNLKVEDANKIASKISLENECIYIITDHN